MTIFGAGRTDAGVHARGQVANFYTPSLRVPLRGLRRAMNARLPGDIAIRSACEVPEGFHASRSAIGKTYRYRIWLCPVRPVGLHGQVYHYFRPLEIEPMRDAGARLVGRHDFRGVATSADDRQDTVRTIFRCEVAPHDGELHVTVQGNAFLYNMVRIIVGTLIEIGRGRWPADRIDQILASRSRRDAGPTAPPDGLCLLCVHYAPRLHP